MKVNILNRKLSLTIADLLHYFLAKALKSFADLHSCGAGDLVHLPAVATLRIASRVQPPRMHGGNLHCSAEGGDAVAISLAKKGSSL